MATKHRVKKKRKRRFRVDPVAITLSATFVVLVTVLVTAIVQYAATPLSVGDIPTGYVFPEGIYIEESDIGGMDTARAWKVAKNASDALMAGHELTFTAAGEVHAYEPGELGVSADPGLALGAAYTYCTRDKLPETGYTETGGRVSFEIPVSLDAAAMRARLMSDTDSINVPPTDAAMRYNPDADDGQHIEYTEPIPGMSVNLDRLCDKLAAEVSARTFEPVVADVDLTYSDVTVDVLRDSVSCIGEFTSSYAGGSLEAKNRVINIEKMADAINGAEIPSGGKWSINDHVGPRTEELGWALAPGIENGVYTDQPGGGVCQVSSTLFNAALLAELEIVESSRHSWPSSYIPIGMDATISTGGPDLVLRNTTSYPAFIMAHCDSDEKTCTVQIYGEKPHHSYKVEYINWVIKTEPVPGTSVEERKTKPNGDPILPGECFRVRDGKQGIYVKIYKRYIDADGSVVMCQPIYEAKYRARETVYYQNTSK